MMATYPGAPACLFQMLQESNVALLWRNRRRFSVCSHICVPAGDAGPGQVTQALGWKYVDCMKLDSGK